MVTLFEKEFLNDDVNVKIKTDKNVKVKSW